MKKTKMNQKTASIAPNTDYDMDIAPPLKLIKISNQPSQLNNITHSAASEGKKTMLNSILYAKYIKL